jgi:hypothetical protein
LDTPNIPLSKEGEDALENISFACQKDFGKAKSFAY